MHILMATVEALEISPDDLVLNRTSLQQLRESNRHYQFGEARSEFIENVIRLNLSSYINKLKLFSFFAFGFYFRFKIKIKLLSLNSTLEPGMKSILWMHECYRMPQPRLEFPARSIRICRI